MFEKSFWFHSLFHKIEKVIIEDEICWFCHTCKRYVPPRPVGVCVGCEKVIILSAGKNFCNACNIKVKAESDAIKRRVEQEALDKKFKNKTGGKKHGRNRKNKRS
jgi:hypothetical protein